MSRIYVQTWRDTYLNAIPFDYLLHMSEFRQEREFFHELAGNLIVGFAAEEAGRMVGFITGGYERDGDEIYQGEIETLYVLKDYQRRGVGRKLVSALAGHLSRNGIYSMLVRVLKLNPYRRFYRKINGTYLKDERTVVAGEKIDLEVYGWLDATLVDE